MLCRETVAVYCENNTEHTDTARTSQETHFVSSTKPNQSMLLGETVAVYCENHTEDTGTFWGQNAEFWYGEAAGTHRRTWKGKRMGILSVYNLEAVVKLVKVKLSP
jgi:hypothetical protein